MTMRLVTRLMLSFLQKPLQLLSKSRSCLTPAFRSQKPGLYCSGSYCRLMNLSKYRSLSSLVEAITDCHETLLRLRDAICISLNPKPNEVNISQSTIVVTATSPSTTACFSLSPPPDFPIRSPTQKSTLSFKKFTPMASLTTTNTTVGLSKTFIKLKEQGKAAATRALARGTNLNSILAMLKEVIPKLSCPIALFTYYNPILKRGVGEFMSIIKDVGVHGLVVPDVPLEETDILRKEALKNNIELVLLTTPTTPMERMKAIAEASEGFLYLVSSIGVTGARASVNERVPALLKEIKEATSKPVAVGFGISKPEQAKQVAGWGADGVIVGSAIVKLLGDAKTPEEGLKELEIFTKSLKSALL